MRAGRLPLCPRIPMRRLYGRRERRLRARSRRVARPPRCVRLRGDCRSSSAGLRKGRMPAIRVRSNYVCGEFGTPKSKRSTRSVPMAAEVANALGRYYQLCAEPRRGRACVLKPKGRWPPRQVIRDPPAEPCAGGGRVGHVSPVPRSAPYLRNGDGSSRRANAHPAGVDGPPRHPNNATLRLLCAKNTRRRAGRRCVQTAG